MGLGTWSWRLGQEEILRPSSKSFLLPPILQDGAGDSDRAICIDNAQCFTDESFLQRPQENIIILQASVMANHVVTRIQGLIAT